MRLRGEFAGPEAFVPIGGDWVMAAEDPSKVDVGQVARLLGEQPERYHELLDELGPPSWTFSLFLASRDPRTIILSRNDRSGRTEIYLEGLFDEDAGSLCGLAGFASEGEWKREVWCFGRKNMLSALRQRMEDWGGMGSPTAADLRITAYPSSQANVPSGDVIERRWYHFLFGWGAAVSSRP